jgi:hypothetical protein
MNIQEKIVIISAEKDGVTGLDQVARTDRLRGMLNQMYLSHGVFSGFTSATRIHNGKNEDVFIVKLKDSDWENELEVLQGYAENFGQEAIFFSDANRNTELLFTDGSSEALGRLVSITKEEAKNTASYFVRQHKIAGKVANTYYYTTKKVQ